MITRQFKKVGQAESLEVFYRKNWSGLIIQNATYGTMKGLLRHFVVGRITLQATQENNCFPAVIRSEIFRWHWWLYVNYVTFSKCHRSVNFHLATGCIGINVVHWQEQELLRILVAEFGHCAVCSYLWQYCQPGTHWTLQLNSYTATWQRQTPWVSPAQ